MPPRRSWLVLAALWLVNFTASVQLLMVAPILPRVAEQLHVDKDALGALVMAYAAALGLFALIGGPVSDRIGRRPILLIGSTIMATALLCHAFASTYEALLAVRALSGVGAGLLSGATVSYISDWFPFEQRGQANGWIASAFAAGQILGVPLGAVLAEGHFQTPFIGSGVLMVAAVALIVLFVPRPDVHLQTELTLRSAITSYTSLLARRSGIAAVVTYFFLFTSVSLFVTYLPTWLEETFHVSGRAVASLFLVGGIANFVVGPIAGALSDRIGRRGLIVGANAGVGLLMLGTTWLVPTFASAYVLFFVIMTFVALRVAPLASLIGSLVPARERGSLVSLALAVGQIGFGGGAALSGVLYERIGFWATSASAGTAALLTALAVATLLPEVTGDADVSAAPQRVPAATGADRSSAE